MRTVRAYAARAEVLASSVVTNAETRAAFARLLRIGATDPRRHAHRLGRLHLDWDDYARIELTPELVREADNLAELHALRGFNAIHLASGF